jgi:hypothetical protein
VTAAAALDVLIAAQKVRALMWPLSQYADQAEELIQSHPMLLPEIEAANTHVTVAIEALERAVAFLNAKFDTEPFTPSSTTEGKP